MLARFWAEVGVRSPSPAANPTSENLASCKSFQENIEYCTEPCKSINSTPTPGGRPSRLRSQMRLRQSLRRCPWRLRRKTKPKSRLILRKTKGCLVIQQQLIPTNATNDNSVEQWLRSGFTSGAFRWWSKTNRLGITLRRFVFTL